ncbi:MAG: hypothetical protein PHN80_04775 [Hespellia sp.]|nr:hypothetical protein [Hespellia sp.]
MKKQRVVKQKNPTVTKRTISKSRSGWRNHATRFPYKIRRKEDKNMEENKQALQEQEMESQEEAENAVENETKSEKFIRLAQSRVTKASVAISRIAYLANTSAYDYTPEQVEQMFLALEQELSQVKVQFQKTEKTKKAFSFQ